MIALIDCNNFFASCERLNDPSLVGKPIIVLSGNDGCVIARSNEAKALGIAMGIPFFKIRKVVQKNGVEICSANIPYYAQVSRRIMRTIASEGFPQEVYSIDECFLKVKQTPVLEDWARELRQRIATDIGIPVSIGIAPSKTLAKLTTYFAKHYAGYKGVCILDSEEKRQRALQHYPLEEVWGLGRRNLAKLRRNGVESISDFLAMPREEVVRLLGTPGVHIREELGGEERIAFNDRDIRKSVSMSRTLLHEISSFPQVSDCVHLFLNSCCRKLRKEHLAAQHFGIYLASNRFRGASYQSCYKDLHLELPTADPLELLPYMNALLQATFVPEVKYKRIGVYFGDLVPERCASHLFDTVDRHGRGRLFAAIDKLDSRFGAETVHIASLRPETLLELSHASYRREISPEAMAAVEDDSPYVSPRFDTSQQ